MTGTIGRPDASAPKAAGSGWTVAGGFWPVMVAGPGGPLFTIIRFAAASVTIAWTAATLGYQLQYSTDLETWTDFPRLTISGASNIQWPFASGPRNFFRLKKL